MRVEQAKSKLPKLLETLAGLAIRCYIDGFRFRHLIGWDGVVGFFIAECIEAKPMQSRVSFN